MSFQFQPATRANARLLIGLVGPSGSGKSLSALRLAKGLVGNGRIAVIDTERGRMLQYAPRPGEAPSPPETFAFDHMAFEPPFSPDRYKLAVEAAAKAHPDVLIIDSLTHSWDGPGGMLEMVDAEKSRMSGNEWAAWAKPKKANNAFVQALLQVPFHVIVTMRAKEKREQVVNDRGKKEIVSRGWHPICESGVAYEMTLNLLLGTARKGAPQIEGFDYGKLPINMHGLIVEGQQLTEKHGEALARWASGTPAKAEPPPIRDKVRTAIEDRANRGDWDGLRTWLEEARPKLAPKEVELAESVLLASSFNEEPADA